MKILILGNGFIAESIIRNLESEGHELHTYSRTFKDQFKCQQSIGDILDFNTFVNVLKWRPQVIINTAWITSHGNYEIDQSNSHYADFTIKLAARVASLDLEHLIVLGSCAEYGPRISPSTANLTRLNPQSFYAKEKVRAFNVTKEILANTDVRFSWPRIFQPYGPNQDPKRLIPTLIDSIRFDKNLVLKDLTTIRDWISTRDIATAISWIIRNPAPLELDIGTSHGYTNLEVLNSLETLMGKPKHYERHFEHVSSGNGIIVVGKESPLLTQGWHPADSLEEGLAWVLE